MAVLDNPKFEKWEEANQELQKRRGFLMPRGCFLRSTLYANIAKRNWTRRRPITTK